MAANREDPNMEYAPMEDPQPAPANRRLPGGRVTKVALVGCGLLALAGVAFVFSPTTRVPKAITVKQLPAKKPQAPIEEVKAQPSHFAELATVRAFNKFLKSSIVADHAKLFEAIPAKQLEFLHKDFLATIGTQAPDPSGFVPKPSKSYRTELEHGRRFEQFKKNILNFLSLNAEEYARNPSSKRARFGITVHADWSEDEFKRHRLTDFSKHPLPAAAKAKAAKASKDKFDNRTSFRKLAAQDECTKSTGGTCLIWPCHASRGATCYESECICTGNSCSMDGVCVKADGCAMNTGGTCSWFGCDSSRNANCEGGSCLCADGTCAAGGKCVDAPAQPTPVPEYSGPITCSTVYAGPIRNQGTCGDCWAFTTAEQLRYMAFVESGEDPGTMSVQYLVDCMPEVQGKSCDDGVKGCCGGLPYRADKWLAQSGGLPTQEDYGPLESDRHPNTEYDCRSWAEKTVSPSSDVNIFSTEEEIANALCKRGPVAIAIDAGPALQSYIGGIMNVDACPADGINHAVLYVGVDREFDDGQPVHIIQNSWGDSWGVGTDPPYDGPGGHVLFKYGENTCNIQALASQPEDVEKLK
mmetsp:Transcript_72444/g.125601  ORF Transcript_72444/g.125601 Transcript_72444/m.125601 type:complete len:583 (+) Transcript_72444:103-1851(+)